MRANTTSASTSASEATRQREGDGEREKGESDGRRSGEESHRGSGNEEREKEGEKERESGGSLEGKDSPFRRPPSEISQTLSLSHVDSLLSFSPSLSAEQITLYDFALFSELKGRECVESAWAAKNKRSISPTICALTLRFNNFANYISKLILLAPVLALFVLSFPLSPSFSRFS